MQRPAPPTPRDQPEPPRLLLLVGTDAPARREHVERLATLLARREGMEPDRIVIDAEEASWDRIGGAVETVPLFPAPRLVWIQHLEKARGEVLDYLADRLPPKSPQTVAVLSADALDRRLRSVQILEEKARVVRVDPPAPKDVPAWIVQRGREMGLTLSREAAHLLHEAVGDDTAALMTELEKFAVAAGPRGTVDARLVEELVSRSLPWAAELEVFQLVDAVVERRRAEAYRVLRRLLAAGKPPLLLLHMLARQYRLLVAACGRPRMGADQLSREMGIKAYPARKVLAQARSMTLARAIAGLEAVLEADSRLKTSAGGEESLILEWLIARLTA